MCYLSDLESKQSDIRKYISRRVFDIHEVDDVVQNINHVAILKQEEFIEDPDDSECFSKWIFGLARFQLLAFFKRRKRNREFLVSEDNEMILEIADLSQASEIDDIFFDGEDIELIAKSLLSRTHGKINARAVLSRLGRQERKVLEFYLKGLTNEEVSAKLGISYNAVATAKNRAFTKIKNILKK